MFEKQLFKCDQNCSKCQNRCILEPDTMDKEIFFEKAISNLGIFNLDIIINITHVIDGIKNSDSEKMLFVADCIEPIIKPLLEKLDKNDLSFLQINYNLNDFLYYISNKIIKLNQKIYTKKGEQNEMYSD